MIGGLSMTELMIILGLALLLLGPDQLPTIAKSLGKGLREIRKATDDLKGQFEEEIARIDTEPAPRMIAPVPPPPDDPAAARAQARIAASNPPPPTAVVDAGAEVVSDDPAAARAAARRAAALKLVPPEGAVPREEPASPATGGARSAQHGIEQK